MRAQRCKCKVLPDEEEIDFVLREGSSAIMAVVSACVCVCVCVFVYVCGYVYVCVCVCVCVCIYIYIYICTHRVISIMLHT
jgi:hypothetical protein